MASLLVLLIILACVVYQYFKGNLVKAFATLIVAICSGVTAIAYFEFLAKLLSKLSDALIGWSQVLSFIVLFVLAFSILQSLLSWLTKTPVDIGFLQERIGRVICGLFLGLILSGIIITALLMAPIDEKFPYERFPQINPNTDNPKKILLNADGFSTGLFSRLSRGSFSGKTSFSAVHPGFLDQLFLNRYKISEKVSTFFPDTSAPILIPEQAVWDAPKTIKYSNKKPIPAQPGYTLTIVRVGLKKTITKTEGTFSLSQVRLICKNQRDSKKPLKGTAINVYPIGYMTTTEHLEKTELGTLIDLSFSDFEEQVKYVDFAFNVPNNMVPVLLEFKEKIIFQLPEPLSSKDAPSIVPFVIVKEEQPEQKEQTEPEPAATQEPQQQVQIEEQQQELQTQDSNSI